MADIWYNTTCLVHIIFKFRLILNGVENKTKTEGINITMRKMETYVVKYVIKNNMSQDE